MYMKPTRLETDLNAEHLTELWKHCKTHLKKPSSQSYCERKKITRG